MVAASRPRARVRPRSWAVLIAAVLSGFLGGCARSTGSDTGLPLRLVADVALPGGPSRFDYQDVDPGRRRLFVAHLGASRIDVVDLDALRVIGTVEGVASVHGVRVAPDAGRLFASATATNEALTVDSQSLAVLARAPTGAFPDGLAYDPVDHKVYVSDETGADVAVVDAGDGHLLGRIALGGEAGNVAYDPAGRRVLVDVQTRGEIAVIDPSPPGAGSIERRVHLTGCPNDHGLQVDATAGLAYVACVGNASLLVLDLASLSTVGRFSVGSDPDVLALDDGARRLYVAAESGVVAMFAVEGRTLRKLGQHRLAAKAHTVAVDPTSHRVYFPLENVGGHPVLRVMAPA